jgi:hypothetical protein
MIAIGGVYGVFYDEVCFAMRRKVFNIGLGVLIIE